MTSLTTKITASVLIFSSLVLSRTVFASIDDPEGPNLLIVIILAMFLFAISIFTLRYTASKKPHSVKLFIAISVQIATAIVLSICFR